MKTITLSLWYSLSESESSPENVDFEVNDDDYKLLVDLIKEYREKEFPDEEEYVEGGMFTEEFLSEQSPELYDKLYDLAYDYLESVVADEDLDEDDLEEVSYQFEVSNDFIYGVLHPEESSENHAFSIEERAGGYYLLDNGKQVTTPGGAIVCTRSEELAHSLVESGNYTNGDYTSPTSLLCFHYSTLDFGLKWTDSEKEEQITSMLWWVHNNDPFLLFRQHVPRHVIVPTFVDLLSRVLPKLPVHQLMCFVILTTNLNSPMLAHYIVDSLIKTEVEYDEWREDFLDDLEEYCEDNDLDFDREWFGDMIDNFVEYFFYE